MPELRFRAVLHTSDAKERNTQTFHMSLDKAFTWARTVLEGRDAGDSVKIHETRENMIATVSQESLTQFPVELPGTILRTPLEKQDYPASSPNQPAS